MSIMDVSIMESMFVAEDGDAFSLTDLIFDLGIVGFHVAVGYLVHLGLCRWTRRAKDPGNLKKEQRRVAVAPIAARTCAPTVESLVETPGTQSALNSHDEASEVCGDAGTGAWDDEPGLTRPVWMDLRRFDISTTELAASGSASSDGDMTTIKDVVHVTFEATPTLTLNLEGNIAYVEGVIGSKGIESLAEAWRNELLSTWAIEAPNLIAEKVDIEDQPYNTDQDDGLALAAVTPSEPHRGANVV